MFNSVVIHTGTASFFVFKKLNSLDFLGYSDFEQ